MNEKNSTYRVEIKAFGSNSYGWEIYRNVDVLPVLRSQEHFVSRVQGLFSANRARLQLLEHDLQN